MLRQCTKTLLPGMVEYVAKVAGMAGEESALQSHLPAVGEIIKAFGILFTTIPEDLRESLCTWPSCELFYMTWLSQAYAHLGFCCRP